MENTTVETNYEIEEQKDPIFEPLFKLLKKSLLRIIIICIILVISVGIVGGIVMLSTANTNATVVAGIEYNFDGAEKGHDPLGRSLDVAKIKSDVVVTNALLNTGLTVDKVKLINNISIQGIVPESILQQILVIKEIATKNPSALEQLNTLSYFPTRYIVTLKNPKSLKLSKDQSVSLLNEIIKEYKAYFQKTYGTTSLLSTSLSEDMTARNYDFYELFDIYNSQLSLISNYLNHMSSSSITFKSSTTQKSFADLKASVDLIRTIDLTKYESLIRSKAMTDNKELSLANMNIKMTNLENRLAYNKTNVANLTIAVEKAKDQIIWIPNTEGKFSEITAQSETFAKLMDELNSANKETASTILEITNLQTRIDSLKNNNNPATEEEKAQARALLANIQSELCKEGGLIDTINVTATDYIETEMLSNALSQSLSATYTTNSSAR